MSLGTTSAGGERSSARPESSGQETSLLWAPLLTICASAFAVEIPFFFFGTPSGHDVEFHLYSWLEVLAQWKHGILYPRWAALAHFGYGEPRFVFYPPASWLLGALVSAVFPWTIASSVYIGIVLVAAGTSMFMLARRWMSRRDAIFAAALYAVNPYHLVIVYWRSAFAELLASCLLPILLLLVLRVAEEGWRVVAPLALMLAAAWLTNAPAAVMIHYSFALLIVFVAWQRRAPRVLLVGAAAVGLGACLAGFYLLPAVYEQRWVNIAEAVSAGSRPPDNFLFIHTTDADHDRFNRIISWIAVLEMVVTFTAAWAARSFLQKSATGEESSGKLSLHESRRLTNVGLRVLAAWAGVCSGLMFSPTAVAWRLLPKLEFMQFPWRWLLCLSMVFAIFVTMGLRKWWMRIAVYVVAILLIATAWRGIQPPWWDNAGDLREMQDNMYTGAGYEGTDEYTPVGADPASVDKDAATVAVNGPAQGEIRISEWTAESRTFTAEMSAPGQLTLRLFRYPAWKTEVNGHPVRTAEKAGTGQMLVPVAAGMNQVQIRFVRTWDRAAGGWISVMAACGLFGVLIEKRRGP